MDKINTPHVGHVKAAEKMPQKIGRPAKSTETRLVPVTMRLTPEQRAALRIPGVRPLIRDLLEWVKIGRTANDLAAVRQRLRE